MKIVLHKTSKLDAFSEYFDFNQIDYVKTDLWTMVCSDDGQFLLPHKNKQQIVIVDTRTFIDILSCDLSYQYLIEYLNNENLLWVGDQFDLTVNLHRVMDQLKTLDSLVPKKSILLWMDAQPISSLRFVNITYELNLYTFVNVPRIKNTITTKNKQCYDFFLTCIFKKHREHRSVLADALQKRSILLNNCLTIFHTDTSKNYIGETPIQNDWKDGFPSMDIYSQSFVEIVPETLFKNYYFITEKTIKPIATKTPFLILSTPGYLNFLKSLGFKTFDSLIDESYDNENDIHIRVEKMLDTLEYIVKNDTSKFYNASKHILDHNYNKLCELSCKKQSILDHAIYNQLNVARQYLELVD